MWRMWRILGIGSAVWLGAWITIFLFPATSLFVFVSIVKVVAALVAICVIHDRWKEKQQRRKLIRVLEDEAPYQAAFQAGGKKMMVSLAFCELFVAHCLEVCDVEKPGDPKRKYRLKDDVDISLLLGMEQIVARNLITYKSFPQLHAAASAHLKIKERNRYFRARPGARSILGDDPGQSKPEQVADRYERILSDAIAYNPPEYSCGV